MKCFITGKSDGAAAPVNKKTYHARLGLARALAKNDADVSEAHKLYSQVIDMAPEVSLCPGNITR